MEKCGLLGLSVKPCGCFPSSTVSPELPRLVSCRADRVSRQASWLPVVISGGSRGCNLCQATWRFGLDWCTRHTISFVKTQWEPPSTHNNLRDDINLKGKRLSYCIVLKLSHLNLQFFGKDIGICNTFSIQFDSRGMSHSGLLVWKVSVSVSEVSQVIFLGNLVIAGI